MESELKARLATWTDVVRRLAAAYPEAIERGDTLEIAVPVPPTGGMGSSASARCAIEVRRVDVAGATWIRLSSRLGSMRHLTPIDLLSENARSTVGVSCANDGELALRQLVPLVGLDAAALDETVRDLAEAAASSRSRLAAMGAPLEAWALPGGRGRT